MARFWNGGQMSRFGTTSPAPKSFIGRAAQFQDLQSTLRFLPRNAAATRLITGPAGVGKSRLAFELAQFARGQGLRVLTARCWTTAHSPTYWPWTQIIRELVGQPRAVDLAELILEDPFPNSSFELFDAVVTILRQASEDQGLVLILEDLHALDPSSQTLLSYVSYALSDAPVTIVGTARTRTEKLAKSFETEVPLTAFSLAETSEYLGDWAGPHLEQVYAASGGLPLHLEHIAHGPAIASEVDPVSVSRPLNNLLQARLARLSPRVLTVLAAAAVLEHSVPTTIAALLQIDTQTVLHALQEAGSMHFVESPRSSHSPTSFTHQIIQDAILASTDPDQLRHLHAQAARFFAPHQQHLIPYARHLIQAGPEFTSEAVQACLFAAQQTLDQLAFESAAQLCQLALAVIPVNHADLVAEQAALNNLLASARWNLSDRDGALAASETAWQLSAGIDSPGVRVKAALGPRFGVDYSGELPHVIASRCEQVLSEESTLSPQERSRVLSSLTLAQVTVAPAVARDTARQALLWARQDPTGSALGYALVAQCSADLSPDSMYHRLTSSQRALAIAQETSDHELASAAWFLFLGALIEQGDISGVDRELTANSPLATRFTELQDNRHSSWFRCLRAILDGDIPLASQFLEHALNRAHAENDPDALVVWGAQFSVLNWIKGDLGPVEPVLRQSFQMFPNDAIWTAALAWLWTKTGRTAAAAGLVANLGPIETIRRDRNWLATLAILAEVAVAIGDEPLMLALLENLLPYSGRLVPIGNGVVCWGTVDRPLGLIALTLGDRDQGMKHLHDAQESCARIGAQVWLAEIQTELAEQYASGPHQDTQLAIGLASQALVASTQMGWPNIAEQSRQVLDALGGSVIVPQVKVPQASDAMQPVIRVLGRFEVVNSQGQVRWTSKRARTLLKVLVAGRGVPIGRSQLLDYLWPGISHDLLANRFAVALTTVRRALDPDKALDLQHFITFDGEYVALKHERLDIDVNEFLDLAHRGLSQHDHDELAAAVRLYTGEAFSDEFAALWAEPLREEAQMVYLDAAHNLAAMSEPSRACDLFRSILALDEFDIAAHEGLTQALYALGSPRQAEVAHSRTQEVLRELED